MQMSAVSRDDGLAAPFLLRFLQHVMCLVEALEEVVEGVGPMAEAEARVLSSVALTRVFSHLHLRDPSAHLDELLEPVADEHCTAAAAAVQGQVEALLKKFRGFAPTPLTRGDTTTGGVSPTGIDGVQG